MPRADRIVADVENPKIWKMLKRAHFNRLDEVVGQDQGREVFKAKLEGEFIMRVWLGFCLLYAYLLIPHTHELPRVDNGELVPSQVQIAETA